MSAPEKVEITLPEGYASWEQVAEALRCGSTATGSRVARQIEAQLPTPEPTGFAAAVRDGKGGKWSRAYPTSVAPWTHEHGSKRASWPYIPGPVTVLHEGWKPEDES